MVSPTFTVFCDVEGCASWEAQEATRARAWKRAQDRGWVRRRVGGGGAGYFEHVCPRCIEAER